MSFTITHRLGQMERGSDRTDLARLLDELDEADPEHGDIAIADESGWSLTVHGGGSVTLENLEEGEPLHMTQVPREKLLELMRLIAAGNVAAVRQEGWRPGYP